MARMIDYEKEMNEESRIRLISPSLESYYNSNKGNTIVRDILESKRKDFNRLNDTLARVPQEEFINVFYDHFLYDTSLEFMDIAMPAIIHLSDNNLRRFIYSSYNFRVHTNLDTGQFVDYMHIIFTLYFYIALVKPGLYKECRCNIEGIYSKFEEFIHRNYTEEKTKIFKDFTSIIYCIEESLEVITKFYHIDPEDMEYIYYDRDNMSYDELESNAMEYMRYIYDLLYQVYENTKEDFKVYIKDSYKYWGIVSSALEYEVGGILWHLIPEEYYERFKMSPVLLQDTGGFDIFKNRCLKILKEDFYV